MTPVSYIKQELKVPGVSFVTDWQSLTEQDKIDLKRWATEEMKILGIK